MELRKPFQASFVAILAALVLAPGASATVDPSADPSCVPPGTEVLAMVAPQALAQTFELTETRVVTALQPQAGDAGTSPATVQLTRTKRIKVGTPSEAVVPDQTRIIASVAVDLPNDAGLVEVVLDPAPTLPAGTYALVVDPPQPDGVVAWQRCADEREGGAFSRNGEPAWNPIAGRLAFTVRTASGDVTAPETTITRA